MKCCLKSLMVVLLVSVLLTAPGLSCGGRGDGGEVTITIGAVTDFTGPASPALLNAYYAVTDLIKYYNEEGLIPGVRLKLITYDAQYNPARDIPGYDWCKERGAKVILAPLESTATALKPFAERDHIVVYTAWVSQALVEPPGWVFAYGGRPREMTFAFMKWVGDELWDWETRGPAKIGFVGWREPLENTLESAFREYCQNHPDQFELVGSFMAPVMTVTFSGEIMALKGCDLIYPCAYSAGYFIKDFRNKGYQAQFISDGNITAYRGFFEDLCGWDKLDGTVCYIGNRWFGEPYPIPELADELLRKYHSPSKAEEIKRGGLAYGIGQHLPLLEALRQAVAEVGPRNLDGQAVYNSLIKFEMQPEGEAKWSYGETKRWLEDYVAVYKWSADVQDLVRLSDWLPAL